MTSERPPSQRPPSQRPPSERPPSERALSRGALLAMEHKYQELLRLRRAQDQGAQGDPRGAMRALAAATPGSLREIDVLPLDALEARLAHVQDALAGAPAAGWLVWMVEFHAWMRLALALRAADLRADAARALSWAHAREREPLDLALGNEHVDDDAVRALLRPEGGRLVPVALRFVARAHDRSAAEVERALFPPVLRLRR